MYSSTPAENGAGVMRSLPNTSHKTNTEVTAPHKETSSPKNIKQFLDTYLSGFGVLLRAQMQQGTKLSNPQTKDVLKYRLYTYLTRCLLLPDLGTSLLSID